jgi:hypothetical protein
MVSNGTGAVQDYLLALSACCSALLRVICVQQVSIRSHSGAAEGKSARQRQGEAACTFVPYQAVTVACLQVALQQADYAAWNIWACINKRPLLPFKYQHLGELMSLGNGGAFRLPITFPEGAQRCALDLSLQRLYSENLARFCRLHSRALILHDTYLCGSAHTLSFHNPWRQVV